MIVEKAQIVATEPGYALVHTDRQSACSRCSVSRSCGASVLSRLVGRRYAQIRVVNRCGAKVGDTVTVGMSEAGLLKSALIVYAVPLLAMMGAALIGTALSGPAVSEAAGIALGVTGFALGAGFARWFSATRAENPDYHPVIVSIDISEPHHTPPSGGRGMLAS